MASLNTDFVQIITAGIFCYQAYNRRRKLIDACEKDMSKVSNVSNKSYSLLDFMPYGKHTRLCDYRQNIKVLQLYIHLLKKISVSTHDFLAQNLSKFDPHIGDNLCQIRACMLLDYYRTEENNLPSTFNYHDFIHELKSEIFNAEQILASHKQNLVLWGKKQYRNPFYNLDINDFFSQLELKILIPEKIFILTLCHFLTDYRMLNTEQNFVINYTRLQKELDLSKDFCRRMTHLYQKQLSILSCEYVSKLVNQSQLPITTQFIEDNLQYDDDGRCVLPCFLVMPILMERLQQLNIPITLIIKNPFIYQEKCEHLNYQAGPQQYSLYSLSSIDPKNSTGFIIHCISYFQGKSFCEFKRKIKKYSINDLLLACMASHPQFSGKNLIALKNNPFKRHKNKSPKLANTLEKQLFAYKNLSNHLGCHKEKPMTLFIQHIFADNINQQINHANNNKFYAEQLTNLTVASFQAKTKYSNAGIYPQFEVA